MRTPRLSEGHRPRTWLRPRTTRRPRRQAPIRWWALAIQFFLVVQLASGAKSALVFALGIAWLVFSLVTRQTGWWRFVFAMLCILAIAAGLK